MKYSFISVMVLICFTLSASPYPGPAPATGLEGSIWIRLGGDWKKTADFEVSGRVATTHGNFVYFGSDHRPSLRSLHLRFFGHMENRRKPGANH
ncbi:MAG: hypothetical protein GY765_10655 [bacterium]|nr:hypothetical protein [bacterium]